MRFIVPILAVFLLTSCGKDVEGLTPEEYIDQNNLQATELENGVYIVIHEPGNDIKPRREDVVDVSYVGKLTDDVVFDSNDNFRAILKDLVQGWYIGLKEIGIGGSCTVIIPHEMGFGDIQNGPIPPKSTLVFDIDLKNISFERTVEEYILDNNLITVELDKSVHLATHEEGDENQPTLDSKVTVNYSGRLTNEIIFDQGENAVFEVKDLIEGWQIGLLEMGIGGSYTLVLPAEVAYGSTGSGSIPPNAPIVFDIELIEVE